MNQRFSVTTLLIGGLALGVLGWWLFYNPVSTLMPSLPGADKRGVGDSASQSVSIGEFFDQFAESSTSLTGVWPQFRGEGSTNILLESVPLKTVLNDGKLPVVWEKTLGEGHAGASVYKGRVYVMDYDEALRADMLHCYELQTGNELWRRYYKVAIKRNHGMSRTVPAVNEQAVVTIGPMCQVMATDRLTGRLLWSLDMVKAYGSEVPFWYTGQCPLIFNNMVILAPAGSKLLIAKDVVSGQTLWESENPGGFKMSHASVMPYVFGGKNMLVYSAVGGVAGVDAENGKVLWYTNKWNHSVVAPSAVCLPNGRIFLTAGYGAGSMMLRIKELNGVFGTDIEDEYSPGSGLACEQQTPLFFDGKLIGIQPKDGGSNRNQLVCVDPENLKKVEWSSGKNYRFGLGPFMIADGKIFILDDEANLTIAKATIKGFEPITTVKLFEGADAWAPFALADGYLILRDSKKMVCLNLKKQS